MALTLTQPWASCVADLGKWIENRDWPPPSWLLGQYLAIHAAKRCDPEDYAAVASDRVKLGYPRGALPAPEQMPLGVIVAVARVAGAVRVETEDFGHLKATETRPAGLDEQIVARALASPWSRGIWLWLLDDVTKIEPVAHRGMQRLWPVGDRELEQVRAAWKAAHTERSTSP
jgi:hypothetical protein